MKNFYQFIFGNRESGKTFAMIKNRSKKELREIILNLNQQINSLYNEIKTLSRIDDEQRETICKLRKIIGNKIIFNEVTECYEIYEGGNLYNTIPLEDYERINKYAKTKRTN